MQTRATIASTAVFGSCEVGTKKLALPPVRNSGEDGFGYGANYLTFVPFQARLVVAPWVPNGDTGPNVRWG